MSSSEQEQDSSSPNAAVSPTSSMATSSPGIEESDNALANFGKHYDALAGLFATNRAEFARKVKEYIRSRPNRQAQLDAVHRHVQMCESSDILSEFAFLLTPDNTDEAGPSHAVDLPPADASSPSAPITGLTMQPTVQPSSTVGVPHCDFKHETAEASASSVDIGAPVVGSKRKRPLDPSDTATKRSRASSPEQVSTNEQHLSRLFGALPALPEEIVESANVQAIVGSSLAEQGDDVIFVEEVERGIEPESTGQEQGDSSRASGGPSVAPTGATEMSQGRSTSQQPPIVAHYSIWDVGNDGIVPSTPTLVTRRGEQEIGGAAHVPQGRFSFGTVIQEPYPTSQFAAPSPDVTTHRSVPMTPRVSSPPASREPAPNSTIVDIVNLGGDQQQQFGQAADPEMFETPGEEPDGSSEAAAATAEGTEQGSDGGDEDSNEPTTLQPRRSRQSIHLNLNRPVTEAPQASGSVPGDSFSEPATCTSSRRRGRGGGRGGAGRGQADQ